MIKRGERKNLKKLYNRSNKSFKTEKDAKVFSRDCKGYLLITSWNDFHGLIWKQDIFFVKRLKNKETERRKKCKWRWVSYKYFCITDYTHLIKAEDKGLWTPLSGPEPRRSFQRFSSLTNYTQSQIISSPFLFHKQTIASIKNAFKPFITK